MNTINPTDAILVSIAIDDAAPPANPDLFDPSTYDPASDGQIIANGVKPMLRIALAYAVDVYHAINGNGTKGLKADTASDAAYDASKVKYQASALRDADSKGGVRWSDIHNDARCPMAVWGFIDAGRVTFTDKGLIATVDMTGIDSRRDFRDVATAKGTLKLIASGSGRKSDEAKDTDKVSQSGKDAPPAVKSDDGAVMIPVDADKISALETALDLAQKTAKLDAISAKNAETALRSTLEHAARALADIAILFGMAPDAPPAEIARTVRSVVDASGKGRNKGRNVATVSDATT